MQHFLQYWKENENILDAGLDHSASAQFKRVHPGDVLWIVTLIGGRLTLLGRIVIGKVVDQRQAEAFFRKRLWEAPRHVIAKNGTEMKSIKTDIQALAPELRFISKSNRNRLILPDRNRTDGRQLQILRELNPQTAEALRTILKSKVKSNIDF